MKRSICGTVAGFCLGAVGICLLEAYNLPVGDLAVQHTNHLLIVTSLSILGAVIDGVGDIVAAIKQGRPTAPPEA